MTRQLDFRISSGLKNVIGKELITSDHIAVFELVKNSYDANANSVRIVFQNIKQEKANGSARILIIDNGDGMSYSDLKQKWLFVGFSDKRKLGDFGTQKDYRSKIKNTRIFAGAKGVGRFSCDRLAKNLKIYTKKKDEAVIHCLEIDWTRFEKDQKKEFQTIKVNYSALKKVKIENYPLKEFKKGTVVEMSSLNDKWNSAKLMELKNYLQRLVNPSPARKDQGFKIYLEAKECLDEDEKNKNEKQKVINGLIQNIVFEKLSIKTTEVKCIISKDTIKTELTDKGKPIFSIEEKNEYNFLKYTTIHVFYLNSSAKNTFTRIMGMGPVKYGSIFLYKNNFRIHPYGDEGDDWLELEKRKGQGYARYLSTRELIGRIELTGVQENFMEVSSRDGGVLKTEAYYQLKKAFIAKVLRRLERYVVEGIDWDREDKEKQKPPGEIKLDSLALIQRLTGQVKDPEKNIWFNPDLLTILKDKQLENLPQVIKNVEALKKFAKTSKEKTYIDKQLKSVKIATKNLELEKNEKERELEVKKRESLFLSKVISTDKDIIINLNHTIENSTQTIKEIIIDINKKIKAGSPVSEIVPFIDELSLENEKIKVLAGIVSLANFNTKVELIKGDVVLYIKEYLEKIVKVEIMRFKFVNDNIGFVRKFRPLEISIMLDNFISNTRKAGGNLMSIKFKTINKELHIQIGDDGKGVGGKISKNIFNRSFTSTRGSGIGLHYIKTIVENMSGSIKFLGNGIDDLGKGACFEVVL